MKILNKAILLAGAISLSVSTLNATTYIVEPGDTLSGIVEKLGFNSMKAAGIESVPSGNINLIFVGDEIKYVAHPKKKRFVLRKKKLDLNKFCFENNKSIHYKVDEKCVPKRFEHKKELVKKKKRYAHEESSQH